MYAGAITLYILFSLELKQNSQRFLSFEYAHSVARNCSYGVSMYLLTYYLPGLACLCTAPREPSDSLPLPKVFFMAIIALEKYSLHVQLPKVFKNSHNYNFTASISDSALSLCNVGWNIPTAHMSPSSKIISFLLAGTYAPEVSMAP